MLWTFTNNLYLRDKNTSNEYKYIEPRQFMLKIAEVPLIGRVKL